jgi:hypothetical protein
MHYLELPSKLANEYPRLIRFMFERTSILDGDYECPKIAKTLEAAFNYLQKFRPEQRMSIDLTRDEIHKSGYSVIVWKTEDYGIIKWAILEQTTPEKLLYILPEPNETKIVSILKTHDPDVLDCEWA